MCESVNRSSVSKFGVERLGWLVLGAAAALLLSGCDVGQSSSDESEVETASLALQKGFEFYPGEEAYVFKSVGDNSVADQAACKVDYSNDPWTPTGISAGRMYSVQYRQSDGAVGNPEQIEIGAGTLCTLPVAPGTIRVRGKIALNDFTVWFDGKCYITIANMPVTGIHHMVCALPLVGPMPEGIVGGQITTNSVLNPTSIPDFPVGSLLTLHTYKE